MAWEGSWDRAIKITLCKREQFSALYPEKHSMWFAQMFCYFFHFLFSTKRSKKLNRCDFCLVSEKERKILQFVTKIRRKIQLSTELSMSSHCCLSFTKWAFKWSTSSIISESATHYYLSGSFIKNVSQIQCFDEIHEYIRVGDYMPIHVVAHQFLGLSGDRSKASSDDKKRDSCKIDVYVCATLLFMYLTSTEKSSQGDLLWGAVSTKSGPTGWLLTTFEDYNVYWVRLQRLSSFSYFVSSSFKTEGHIRWSPTLLGDFAGEKKEVK